MPRMSTKINVDACISISFLHLNNTNVPELLKETYDFSAPGGSLKGVVTALNARPDSKTMCQVRLNDLPDLTFDFLGTKLKYAGINTHQSRIRTVVPVQANEGEESNSSADEDDEEEVAEEVFDITTNNNDWVMGPVTVDSRNILPSYRTTTSKFNLPNKSTASPADYFFFFLPMDHIRDVVVPSINIYASSVVPNWVDVTFIEYMTWMALIMTMIVMVYANKKAH